MKYDLSEVIEIIENRRTVYPEQFSDRKVHKEIIEKMLNAAKWAPTHKLTQPWRFTVFMEEGLHKVSNFHADLYKQLNPDSFIEAKYNKIKNRGAKSSAIIALAMKRDDAERIPVKEEIASASIAVQNMCLVATAYGIGTYWGSGKILFSDPMKSFLNLEQEDEVLGFLYVGYPEGDWPRKTPRKPVEYFTSWVEE